MKNRKELILKEIVDHYIDSGEPVSSKVLLDKYDLSYSSATIRNDMHELEEEGFLKKPYTSGGRIPTVEGYRYFVNWLLELSELSHEEQKAVVEAYEFEHQNTERLLRNTASLLSNITGYTGFVLGPNLEDRQVAFFTLTQLDKHHLLAILVTDVGLVENRVIKSKKEVDGKQLNKIVPMLTDRLQGKKIEDLMKLKDVSLNEEGWYNKLTRDSFLFVKKFMQERSYRRLYTEGLLNLISEDPHNDQDARQLKQALKWLDEETLSKMTEKCDEDNNDMNVLVGIDDDSQFLPYSLITKNLANCSSSLGVLGPIDMDYSKSFSTVQYIGNRLDSLLTAGKRN